MTDPRLQSASETLSLSIAQLLHYWSRQNEKIYDDLISLFWNRINQMCSSAVSNALLDITILCTVLDAQSNLLIALRFPNPKRQKKQLKVRVYYLYKGVYYEDKLKTLCKHFSNNNSLIKLKKNLCVSKN